MDAKPNSRFLPLRLRSGCGMTREKGNGKSERKGTRRETRSPRQPTLDRAGEYAGCCRDCFATLSGMPFKLAFMTVGILREAVGHAQVQGFVDRIPDVYAAADSSDGFHDRSIRDVGTWLHSWGPVELPGCF